MKHIVEAAGRRVIMKSNQVVSVKVKMPVWTGYQDSREMLQGGGKEESDLPSRFKRQPSRFYKKLLVFMLKWDRSVSTRHDVDALYIKTELRQHMTFLTSRS